MLHLVAFALVPALFGGSASADAPASLKLGYARALSGKGAFLGVQSKAGAELAAAELN